MRTIDLATVQALVSYRDAVDAMRDAFVTLANGGAIAPDEFMLSHPVSGEVHIKGAHLIGSPWMVTKVVSAGFQTPGNHGFSVVLSAQSGAIEALIDDNGWLTEVRTAAAGALSVQLLARQDARSVAIIGSGIQAGYQLAALRCVREVSDVRVAGRTSHKVNQFADEHGAVAYASVSEAVRGADIVICATTSRAPVLDWVEPGTHITAMGADMAGKRELSISLMERADAVIVDDVALARHAGVLQGVGDRTVGTIGELLTKRAAGRVARDQITVAGLCGLGVQDAAIAGVVMGRLEC
jgi:ornithine cyclodeaminase